MDSLIKDILVIGIAAVALILSLINTWHTMWRDKIKLRMHTVEVFDSTTGKKMSKILAVNIVNLSYIAVTIDRVELFIEGANNKEEILSFSEVSKQLPKRLEPRSNEIVKFVGVKNPNPLTKKATHVVAKTACGYTVRCKFNPSLYH